MDNLVTRHSPPRGVGKPADAAVLDGADLRGSGLCAATRMSAEGGLSGRTEDEKEEEENGHRRAPPSPLHRVPVQFGAITPSNIEMLRTLNVHIFPVRYNDTFYGDVLFVPKGYAQFAYWDGLVVGAICCRHEPVDTLVAKSPLRTYIMTLGVLEPYRHYKIGSALLRGVIQLSQRDAVDHIYLHVQTSNDAALRFYRHFGFHVRETIRNYYKRLEPPDCFVLEKKLTQAGHECKGN